MISGTETLARKLDMAVIYWDMEKPAADVTASPADSSARTRRNARHSITLSYAAMLQETIERNPSIWLWTHNRWKYPRTTPLIAVVILNWNGAHLLREYLPASCRHNRQPHLAYHSSRQRQHRRLSQLCTADIPRKSGSTALGSNYGFAEGYNCAIAALDNSYRYAVLLNSDAATRKAGTLLC